MSIIKTLPASQAIFKVDPKLSKELPWVPALHPTWCRVILSDPSAGLSAIALCDGGSLGEGGSDLW